MLTPLDTSLPLSQATVSWRRREDAGWAAGGGQLPATGPPVATRSPRPSCSAPTPGMAQQGLSARPSSVWRLQLLTQTCPSAPSPTALWQRRLLSTAVGLPLWRQLHLRHFRFHISTLLRYVSFSVCLTSLTMTISRSTQVAAKSMISFLFMAEQCFTVSVCARAYMHTHVCVCTHTPHLYPFLCQRTEVASTSWLL